MPDIQTTLVDKYGTDIEVIAIDPDSQDYTDIAAVAAFVANQGVDYTVAVEETSLYPTYSTIEFVYDGSNPYPVDVIIDKNGIMRYIAREYDPVAMDEMIAELLLE